MNSRQDVGTTNCDSQYWMDSIMMFSESEIPYGTPPDCITIVHTFITPLPAVAE